MKKSKNKLKKGSVKRLIGLFLPHKRDCVFMFFMLIISSVFVSVGPRVLGMATDSIVSGLELGGINWQLFQPGLDFQ